MYGVTCSRSQAWCHKSFGLCTVPDKRVLSYETRVTQSCNGLSCARPCMTQLACNSLPPKRNRAYTAPSSAPVALTRDHHWTSINTIPNFSILRSPHQKPRRRRRRRHLRGRHRGRPHDRHPSHGLRSSLPSVPNRQHHQAPWRVVALAIRHLRNSRLWHQHRGRLVEPRAGLQGPRHSLDRHHGED